MDAFNLIVVFLALLVAVLAAGGVWVATRALNRPVPEPSYSPPIPYDDAPLKLRIDELQQAVANGIQQVDKNNRRIEAVVRRARKELEEYGLEHPTLEAEAGDLRLVDAGGSKDERVLEVPGAVEADFEDRRPSPIPGLTWGEYHARQLEHGA